MASEKIPPEVVKEIRYAISFFNIPQPVYITPNILKHYNDYKEVAFRHIIAVLQNAVESKINGLSYLTQGHQLNFSNSVKFQLEGEKKVGVQSPHE